MQAYGVRFKDYLNKHVYRGTQTKPKHATRMRYARAMKRRARRTFTRQLREAGPSYAELLDDLAWSESELYYYNYDYVKDTYKAPRSAAVTTRVGTPLLAALAALTK